MYDVSAPYKSRVLVLNRFRLSFYTKIVQHGRYSGKENYVKMGRMQSETTGSACVSLHMAKVDPWWE